MELRLQVPTVYTLSYNLRSENGKVQKAEKVTKINSRSMIQTMARRKYVTLGRYRRQHPKCANNKEDCSIVQWPKIA